MVDWGSEPPLRVGRIDFANCSPIFRALERIGDAGVEYVGGVPTELNRRLREGTVDLSPSSSVEFLERPDLYGFLPDLSISAIGPVMSVALFSRRPLEALDGCTVALTGASATSVVLTRVLLEGYRKVRPRYGRADAPAEAALWIGDRALKEVRAGGWPFVYDLGALWFQETATPFVFALWICRREAYRRRPEAVRALYRRLIRARQLAYRSYPEFAREAPEARWMGAEGLLEYWRTISYDLTAWHLEGLRRFAEDARALGLLPRVPPLRPLPVESP
ncbi:MAG: menaquinone biosynthesis protein [Deferrisomatales bacterium]